MSCLPHSPPNANFTKSGKSKCDHSNENTQKVLSNGGVPVVAEQNSCFCHVFVYFNRET